MNIKSPNWTGMVGEVDQQIRNIGKPHWVFEYQDGLVVTDNNYTADQLEEVTDYAAWLYMIAVDAEDAKKNFYNAQDQWRAYENGVEDFLSPGDPESGHVRGEYEMYRDDAYETWAKEMESRYGISVSPPLED
jgi:hypothetical protein